MKVSIESTIIQKNKKRIYLFLAGFVFFWLVGGLVRDQMGDLTVYSKHWFVDIGYKTLAAFFRRALGLPIRGGFGVAFSLVASIFYLVCGILLYQAPSTYESVDAADNEWHGILSRGAHFICSYCYLPLVSYVMVDWGFFAVVNDHRVLASIGFIIFLVYLFVSLIQFFQEPETVCRMKWLTRCLSSFAIMLGVSGVSNAVWDLELTNALFLPAHVVGWMNRLASNPATSLWHVLLLILVLATLLLICVFCAYQIGKRTVLFGFSVLGSLLLGFFAMKFYGKHSEIGLDYRALTQWILIVVMSVIWGMMSKSMGEGKVIPVVGFTMGFTISLLALFRAARLFYAPVDRLLAHYSEKAVPLQDAAWAWGQKLIPSPVVLMLVVFVVAIVAMYLTFIPYYIQKRPMLIPKGILRLLCLLFHAGILLRFMGQDWFFIGATSYILIAISLTGLMASLVAALICLDFRSLFWVIYALVTTAVIAIPYILFAYTIAFILIGILVSVNTIGMVNAFAKAAPGMAKDLARKEMLDSLGLVDSAVESGDLTLAQGMAAASAILDSYTPLL